MPKSSTPKKTDGLYLRFEEQLAADFEKACKASSLSQQDALRLAAEAMVRSHTQLGRIPRDMEVRQRFIGSMEDAVDLLRRSVELSRKLIPYPETDDADTLAVAEDAEKAARIITEGQPPRPDHERGRGHSKQGGA